jgi:hypothetical protein
MGINLSSKLRLVTDETSPSGKQLAFYCPGCKARHIICVQRGTSPSPVWSWNGDAERPIFSPSILVRGIRWDMNEEELEAYDKEFERVGAAQVMNDRRFGTVCHSFVGCNGARPGQIIFLSDCTHSLAGQVVDLADLNE